MTHVRALSKSRLVRARTRSWLLLLTLSRHLGRRGYYRVCRLARQRGDRVAIQIASDTELVVPVGDIYWNTLLETPYEPDVASALDRHLGRETHFVDCGANIGYWSMLVRNTCASVVAVEASSLTFARLQENAELNHVDPARVTLLNRAVWNTSGAVLTIKEHDVHHAAASVTGDAIGFDTDTWHTSEVVSLSLSDLVDQYLPADGSPVVLKLDVEGAEREALDGLVDVATTRPLLVVYEDHGGDPSCEVTRHLHELGYRTVDLMTGREMDVDDVRGVKTDDGVGYNFGAFRPGSWTWA